MKKNIPTYDGTAYDNMPLAGGIGSFKWTLINKIIRPEVLHYVESSGWFWGVVSHQIVDVLIH